MPESREKRGRPHHDQVELKSVQRVAISVHVLENEKLASEPARYSLYLYMDIAQLPPQMSSKFPLHSMLQEPVQPYFL